MSKKQQGKFKVTVVLNQEAKAALVKRAQKEGLSIAALIRRFALGLAALVLIACGGETFSSPGPVGSAGMPSGSAGMGSGGSGGMPGAAGMGGGYDGPAWVECADGVLTARGIEAMMSEVEITVGAEYWGPDYDLFVSCALGGEKSAVGSAAFWTTLVSGTFVTISSHFDKAIIPVTTPTEVIELDDEVVSRDDFLSCSLTWSSEIGSGDVKPQRCLVRVAGAEVAAWSPAP